jgi:hypothetical protein
LKVLRITVEIFPGGDKSRRREIAHANIGNISQGALALYRVRVSESGVAVDKTAEIDEYPRWSASIWDLIVRPVAKAMIGNEALPPRPGLLKVPIYNDDGFSYVKITDIPEPARSAFLNNMHGSTRPVVEGAGSCAFSWDWLAFQAGER